MGKKLDVELLQKEHQLLFGKCEGLCKEIIHQLLYVIESEKIKLAVPIQFRAKSWLSVLDKIEQGRFVLKKSIQEFQDLAGIRIILLFQRDVEKVVKLIETNFDVIKNYNTGDRLENDQFGYSSIHIISKLKEQWLGLPTLSEYSNMQVEIQIRTLSQHSWAEASNIFQYKNETNVPKPLKRSISRISALLETVDLEYERLITERSIYKNEIQTTKEELDVKLNVDLVEEVMNRLLPEINKVEVEQYSNLIRELEHFQIDTKSKLEKLIGKNLEAALINDEKKVIQLNSDEALRKAVASSDPNTLTRLNQGVFYTHSGLLRQIMRVEFGDEEVKKLLSPSPKK